MRVLAWAAIASVCATAEAAAQERGIPKDLVLGLLSDQMEFDSRRAPEIVVGQLPRHWTSLPRLEWPILGSAVFENAVLVVYRVTEEPEAAQRRAHERLKAAGWRQPAGIEPPPDVGFVGSEISITDLIHLCRENQMAFATIAQIRSDLRVLKLSITREPDNPCVESPGWTGYTDISVASGYGFAVGLSSSEKPPMPKLDPPRGARVIGFGVMPGVSRFNSEAIVTTELSTAKVMEHYAEQMHAQGWSSRGSADNEFTKVHTWRMAHEGKEWLATLTATGLSGNRHAVEIALFNLSEVGR
jgi:hypothetical protein